jgi:hypothetical protein
MPLSKPSRIPFITLPKVVQFAVIETTAPTALQPTSFPTTTAGNALVVLCASQKAGNTATTFTGVTDTQGNKYVPHSLAVLNDPTSNTQMAAFVAFKVAGGASNVITVAYSAESGTFVAAYSFEVSGILGIDGGSGNVGQSGATASSGNFNMARARGIALACTINTSSGLSAGPGCILINVTGGFGDVLEYAVGISGSHNLQANLNGSQVWGMIAAGFYGTP